MSTDTERREVYALRYARSAGTKKDKFHRYGDHGADDGDSSYAMDFFFWLIRDEHHTVLVDCGFDGTQTAFPSYHHDTDPLELLARLDVEPDQVDHLVLTHMHFDHIGNVGLFPRATVTIARAELDFWTGPHACKPHIGVGGLAHEVAAVAKVREEGRLRLVDDPTTVVPGVDVWPAAGHTPGQLVADVTVPGGTVVLASDATHFYEEMDRDRPFWLFHDLAGMYRTYEALRERAAQPHTWVVPGHDPAVMERFALAAPECADLTRPVVRDEPSAAIVREPPEADRVR